MENITSLDIFELHELLKAKKISAVEIIKAFLENAKKEEDLNAYITLRDEAVEEAKQVDEKIAEGRDIHPLAGIPYGIKDAICTKGIRSTASAKILDNYIPPFSATVVNRIQEKGGIILGKHNCDAFGHGASNENSQYGPVKNPWNRECVAGGSSGGSAASVAADTAVYAIGEDTGGSIRVPAAFCGVTGLRPSYGRNSRYGIMPMASSMDTVGPMAKSVKEVALLMEVMAGRDPLDATTLHIDVPEYSKYIEERLPKYTIGIPKEYFEDGLDPNIRKLVEEAIRIYEQLGCTIKHVSLPLTKYGIPIYYVVVPSEDSANLARLDGIRYGSQNKDADDLFEVYAKSRQVGFPPEVKRRIMIGTYALSAGYYDAYYKKAQQVRTLVKEEFQNIFQEVDMLATPVSPMLPFKIGEKANDPLAMYLVDIYMTPASVAGQPALSLPVGFSNGLPVGMQLIGRQGKEEEILHAGHWYQKETDWHKKRP